VTDEWRAMNDESSYVTTDPWINYFQTLEEIRKKACKVKPFIVTEPATQIEVKLMRKIIKKGGKK